MSEIEEFDFYDCDYFNDIDYKDIDGPFVDLNELYDAFRAALSGSSWKPEPQRFELDFLTELFNLKHEIQDEEYQTSPGSEFILNERGKIRFVHGGIMRDRVVGHWLCDTQINPAIQPYLIYNNGASQKGKGISFSRGEFEKDLHNFYLTTGSNEGWIGFVDMSKFYDNIRHSVAKELLAYMLKDEFIFSIFCTILESFRVDVSYMTDEEFDDCLDVIFNSIEYHATVPKEKMTGEKWMEKSADIGDQIAQSIGMYYPVPIDNYAKIVRSCRWYGRYMDDIYIICKSLEELKSIIDGIEIIANKLGLFVNRKKTRIVRLCDNYQYLQVKYTLSDTGKVIKKINPKSVTRERRKLKAYKRLLDKGLIDYESIEQAYKSWMGAFAKLMSKKQISHMKALYKELFGKEIRWKQQ